MNFLQIVPNANDLAVETDNMAIKILLFFISVGLFFAIGLGKLWYDNFKSDKTRQRQIEDEERERQRRRDDEWGAELGEVTGIVEGLAGWSKGIGKRLDALEDQVRRHLDNHE